MTIDHLTKTQHPSAADRAYVTQLVADLGLRRAALRLGLSRLATLRVAAGQPIYTRTQQAIRKAREAA